MKEKTVYICSNCGQDSPKWIGKCPSCGEWNTYVEEVVRKPVAGTRPLSGLEPVKSKPVILSEITGGDEPRIDMHDEELNRVLGGGLVPGSLVLLGGEPGIGKSTLVLQTVLRLPEKKIAEAACRPHPSQLIGLPDSMRNIFGTDLRKHQEHATRPGYHRLHTNDINRDNRVFSRKPGASARMFRLHP